MNTEPFPLDILDERVSGILHVRWNDDSESTLPHAVLRQACRCAGCEQLRRDGALPMSDAAVRLTAIHPVADKALNLVFSDGHERGIYPWAYLRELGRRTA